jgi:hypothetical protein
MEVIMSGLFKKVAIITVLSSGLIGNFALAQQAPTNKDSGIYLTIGGGGSLLDYRNSDFQQSVEESFLPVANVASWSGITTSYQSFLGFGGIGYAVNKWIAFETDAYTPIKSEFNGHFVDNSGSKYTDGFSNKLYTYDLLGILSLHYGRSRL